MLNAQARPAPAKAITVVTEPEASVWIDNVNFGKADASGRLTIKSVPAGRRTVRVLLAGYKEVRRPLNAASAGSDIRVPLARTTDAAELALQSAIAVGAVDRQKAIAEFERAASLRPRFAEALLGLARTLSEAGEYDRALAAVARARAARPGSAEASVIEARVYKDLGDEKKAVASFKRAIAEGGGFQPEAYTGLGLLYKDKAEAAGSSGDFAAEKTAYGESAQYLSTAIKQLGSAPDAVVVYQLLGLVYEKQARYSDAINVYEAFLRLFPESSEATAVQSFIIQIKKQLADQK